MEKERVIEVLNKSIELIKKSHVYICDTFLEQRSVGAITRHDYDFIMSFFGRPCDVPKELRGNNWMGTEWNFWKKGDKESRINYLLYLIKKAEL